MKIWQSYRPSKSVWRVRVLDPVCTMTFCSFMWPSDLFSSATSTPVEASPTRDAGLAIRQFKDQMVDYKNQQSNDQVAKPGVVETSSVEQKPTYKY